MNAVRLIIFSILLPLVLAPSCNDDDHLCGRGHCPKIETDVLPVGHVGVWYDFTFKSNGKSDHLAIDELLPANLKLDHDEGRIYGFPSIAGAYPFRVCYQYSEVFALDAYDCKDFTLTINADQ
jgi:hypothetical protein